MKTPLATLLLIAATASLEAQQPTSLPEAALPPGIPGPADFPTPKVFASVCHASSRGKVTFASGPNDVDLHQRGQISPENLVVKTGANAFVTLSLSNGVILKLSDNSSLRFEEFRQVDLPPEGAKSEEAFPSRLRLYLEEGCLYYTGPKLRSQSFILVSTSMGMAHIQGGQAYVETRIRPGFTDEVDVFTNQGLIFVHPGSLARAPETIKPLNDNICELRQSTKLNPVNSNIRTHVPEFLKACQEQYLRMDFASSRILWTKDPATPAGSPAKLIAIPNVPAKLLAIEPAVRYTP